MEITFIFLDYYFESFLKHINILFKNNLIKLQYKKYKKSLTFIRSPKGFNVGKKKYKYQQYLYVVTVYVTYSSVTFNYNIFRYIFYILRSFNLFLIKYSLKITSQWQICKNNNNIFNFI